MAKYKHDVFISYAHIDNEPDLPGQQGWISIFQGALRARLSKLLGRTANVWWDGRELRGNRLFDETIEQACNESAVMVAIVSPRYVQSASCREELAYFTGAQGEPLGDTSRLFTAGKTPLLSAAVEELAHPKLLETLQRTLGYRFYYEDEATKRPRELHTYDPELSPIFQRKLEELAQDLVESLHRADPGGVRALRDSGLAPRAPAGPSEPVGAPGEQVFLAETGSDTRHVRDALVLALADGGVEVAAPSAWSDEYQTAVTELQEAITGASISVHVVGATYGARPDGDAADRSLPELHFDLVGEVARHRDADSPLLRIVWLPSEVSPTSGRQQHFIERLRTFDWSDDDEFLTGSRQDLAQRILAKRETLAARRRARKQAEADEQRRARERAQQAERSGRGNPPIDASEVRCVYVISERRDHEHAEDIKNALALPPDWEVLSAAEVTEDAGDDNDERERIHQAYLSKSDAVLFYHGRAKFSWLRAQADEVRRAFGRRGLSQFVGSVYVARPLEGARSNYQLAHFQRLSEIHEEPERNLQPFVELLLGTPAKSGAAQ